MSAITKLMTAGGGGVALTPASSIASDVTVNVPSVTDTLVNLASTQTLTNKTLTSPTITGASVSSMASSVITSGTAVASTSGTSIDFTGIPSWAKRITVMFNGVSTNGSSGYQVQLGSGSVTTTGYVCILSRQYGGITGTATSTTGFWLNFDNAAFVISGHVVFTLVSGNNWIASGVVGSVASTNLTEILAGNISLSNALDRIRIGAVNGTDTFDAGSINILYE